MKFVVSALTLVAVMGALLLTGPRGLGLSPDSASYLCAGEFLARGQGPRVPFGQWSESEMPRLRHFPPGFPALIALPTALGLDATQAARLVVTLAAGATVALSALVAGYVAGVGAAALAGSMVMLTPALVRNHAVVLSEPAFLSLLVLALVLMVLAPRRVWSLGVVVAAAALVRYAGVALVAAAALWMLWQPGPLSVRVRRACFVALPAMLSIALWNRWTGHFRDYGYRPGLAGNLPEAWQTLVEWIVPAFAPSALRSVLAVGMLSAVALVLHSRARVTTDVEDPHRPASLRLLRACLLIAGCYVAVVVVSRLFADGHIPFDWRLLSPVILLTEIAFSSALVPRWNTFSRAQRATAGALTALWFAGSGSALAHSVSLQHAHGWGYEAQSWQRSEVALWLRTEGEHYELYTNDPAAIWHVAHRISRLLPSVGDAATLQKFSAVLRQRPSAILAFSEPFTDTVSAAELADRFGLAVRGRFDKADVWSSEGAPSH